MMLDLRVRVEHAVDETGTSRRALEPLGLGEGLMCWHQWEARKWTSE